MEKKQISGLVSILIPAGDCDCRAVGLPDCRRAVYGGAGRPEHGAISTGQKRKVGIGRLGTRTSRSEIAVLDVTACWNSDRSVVYAAVVQAFPTKVFAGDVTRFGAVCASKFLTLAGKNIVIDEWRHDQRRERWSRICCSAAATDEHVDERGVRSMARARRPAPPAVQRR